MSCLWLNLFKLASFFNVFEPGQQFFPKRQIQDYGFFVAPTVY